MSDPFFPFFVNLRRPGQSPTFIHSLGGSAPRFILDLCQSISCSLSTNGVALRLVKIVAVPMPLLHS
jgi:hypothetical protein